MNNGIVNFEKYMKWQAVIFKNQCELLQNATLAMDPITSCVFFHSAFPVFLFATPERYLNPSWNFCSRHKQIGQAPDLPQSKH